MTNQNGSTGTAEPATGRAELTSFSNNSTGVFQRLRTPRGLNILTSAAILLSGSACSTDPAIDVEPVDPMAISSVVAEDPTGNNYASHILTIDKFVVPPLETPQDVQAAPALIAAQIMALTPPDILDFDNIIQFSSEKVPSEIEGPTVPPESKLAFVYGRTFIFTDGGQLYTAGLSGEHWHETSIDGSDVSAEPQLGSEILDFPSGWAVGAKVTVTEDSARVAVSAIDLNNQESCDVISEYDTTYISQKPADELNPSAFEVREAIPQNFGTTKILDSLINGDQLFSLEEINGRMAYAISQYSATPSSSDFPAVSKEGLSPKDCALDKAVELLSGQVISAEQELPATESPSPAATQAPEQPGSEAPTQQEGLKVSSSGEMVREDEIENISITGIKEENTAYKYYVGYHFKDGAFKDHSAILTIDCATNRDRSPYVKFNILGPRSDELNGERPVIMEPNYVSVHNSTGEDIYSFGRFLPEDFDGYGCIVTDDNSYLLPNRGYLDNLVAGASLYVRERIEQWQNEGGYDADDPEQ